MSLEKLNQPPIVEVICGILFDELPEIDPLLLGLYWDRRRGDYPRHQILPAIGAPDLVLGVGQGYPPTRTWFISADDSIVLQLQSDRLYLNWRERGGAYPRFSSKGGLMDRTLGELARFAEFSLASFGKSPEPRAIELGKTDHFLLGRHYSDSADLARMIPTLKQALSLTSTAGPEIALHVREALDGGMLRISLQTAVVLDRAGQRDVGLRMETTIDKQLEAPGPAAIAGGFILANAEANRVFEALIPRDQRDHRFQ